MRQYRKAVLILAGLIMAWQWGIAIYAMSQSSQGTDQPALLISRALPPLPQLPNADPFHSESPSQFKFNSMTEVILFPPTLAVCIFISTLTVYVINFDDL